MAAQEQLRQQYLAAMGVTSWLPRQSLPGAAPSPQWRWLDSTSSSGAAASDTKTQPGRSTPTSAVSGVAQARSALAGLMSARPSTPSGPQAKQQISAGAAPSEAGIVQTSIAQPVTSGLQPSEPTTESKPSPVTNSIDQGKTAPVEAVTASLTRQLSVSTGEIPRFRLALLAYDHCLVVTELPLRHAQPWSETHQQLLTAIVAASGLAQAKQAPTAYREFTWPMDPAAVFDQSEKVARHALEVELAEVRLPEQRALLLMGASAARYLMPSDQSPQQGVLLGDDQRQVLCCHGLNEVLRLPGLKAELWRQLQPLRQFASTLDLPASISPSDQPKTAPH